MKRGRYAIGGPIRKSVIDEARTQNSSLIGSCVKQFPKSGWPASYLLEDFSPATESCVRRKPPYE